MIMERKNSVIILMVYWFMVLDHNLITCIKLSAEEDSNLEKQLKSLNKPAVTTIQTKYGESYDCVDFYQQPAFDHPLLRDHKYEYKMSTTYEHDHDSSIDPFDLWLNGKGCPANTVPIKRTTKEDLIRINLASELAHNNLVNENPGVQVAVLKTSKQKIYYGAGMSSSVYHPTVQKTQYSASRIIMQNGVDGIAAGWTVNPSLYPDNETHFFIYTNTKDLHCYNTYCPGFIITRSDVPLDRILKPYTIIRRRTYDNNILIVKGLTAGNWVLVVKDDNITIGYWPGKIFSTMADSANYISWGGEVYSPPGIDPPPMGSGRYLTHDLFSNCYGRKITVVNEEHELDRNPASCITYQSGKRYNVIDGGLGGPKLGRIIVFGGK